MLTPLRSALEHLQEMQSYGKGYLCRHELEEDTILNGVKVEDTVGGTALGGTAYAHQPRSRRTCS